MGNSGGDTEKRGASDVLCKVERIVKNLKVSRETVNTAERDLMEAENNYKLVKRRYDRGACDSGEVSEALESLTKANVTSYQAKYDFQIAMIGLDEILSMDIMKNDGAESVKKLLSNNEE